MARGGELGEKTQKKVASFSKQKKKVLQLVGCRQITHFGRRGGYRPFIIGWMGEHHCGQEGRQGVGEKGLTFVLRGRKYGISSQYGL